MRFQDKLLLLSVLLSFASAERVLKQIHVLTRHGSRTEVNKDADTLAERGGATLTPLGQAQLYKLGEWLRQHYMNFDNDGDKLQLEFYNPSLHRLQSTNFDRTLSSANALALGLFPLTQRVTSNSIDNTTLLPSLIPTPPAIPVYSVADDNDIYLRAYRHCPQFHDNLQRLYGIPEWINGEKANDSLLKKLANIFPEYAVDGQVPMKDIWNVYDPIHVAVTECADQVDEDGNTITSSYTCDSLVSYPSLATALSNDDFARLERLVHEVEHLKFGRQDTAGNLLGSNLLWQILERAAEPQGGSFFLYSAHAPTLLGFLSTLQASDGFIDASRGEKFIDYGGALILEIYEDINDDKVGNGLFLKLKYKSLEGARPVAIPLKEGSDGRECGGNDDSGEERMCGLSKFTVWATEHTLIGTEHWCNACGNEYADVCLRSKYVLGDGKGAYGLEPPKGSSSSSSVQSSSDSGNTAASGVIVAVAFIVGFAVGLVAMGFAGYLCGFPRKHKPDASVKQPKDGVVMDGPLDSTFESSETRTASPDSNGDVSATAIEGEDDLEDVEDYVSESGDNKVFV